MIVAGEESQVKSLVFLPIDQEVVLFGNQGVETVAEPGSEALLRGAKRVVVYPTETCLIITEYLLVFAIGDEVGEVTIDEDISNLDLHSEIGVRINVQDVKFDSGFKPCVLEVFGKSKTVVGRTVTIIVISIMAEATP